MAEKIHFHPTHRSYSVLENVPSRYRFDKTTRYFFVRLHAVPSDCYSRRNLNSGGMSPQQCKEINAAQDRPLHQMPSCNTASCRLAVAPLVQGPTSQMENISDRTRAVRLYLWCCFCVTTFGFSCTFHVHATPAGTSFTATATCFCHVSS